MWNEKYTIIAQEKQNRDKKTKKKKNINFNDKLSKIDYNQKKTKLAQNKKKRNGNYLFQTFNNTFCRLLTIITDNYYDCEKKKKKNDIKKEVDM